ncbi:hypothetical protein VKT23_006102 [Stygiomarasmius scandens]|uniref:PARP catalytic domain-containing protein n=1 Tax=Marasmiellus scandens TaxID=2682957 RepID=A0ABR1JPC3_9AGAR
MIDLTFDDDSDSDISRVHGQNRHPASVQSSSASCAQLGKRKKRASTSGSTLNQSSAIVIETDSEDEVPKTTSSFSANAKTKRHKPLLSDTVAASNSKRVRNDSTEDITASVDTQNTTEIDPGPSGQNDPSFHPEDAELAKRLAEEERKEYRELIKNIEGREEGIVFRVVVNADGTLEDGSPAHPDDIARFEPWRQNFEALGWKKVKRFHWIVNYELEKRFEAARDELRNLLGEEPGEMRLWHGTEATNIDPILKGGLRIGGVDGHPIRHGTLMGRGIYLAKDGPMAVSHAMDADKIFVLTGRTTKDLAYSMRLPPSTELGHEEYHSYSDDSGSVYVMIEYEQFDFSATLLDLVSGTALPAPGPMMPMPMPPIPGPGTFPIAAAGPTFGLGAMIPVIPSAAVPGPSLAAAPAVPPRKAAPKSRRRTGMIKGDHAEGTGSNVRVTRSRRYAQENEDDAHTAGTSRAKTRGKGKARA